MQNCWESIVREYAAAVLGAALRVLGNTDDAEDVAQEVFLEAYLKWDQVDDLEWPYLLRRLAVYRALDRRRSRKPTAPSVDLAKVPAQDAGPIEAAMANELSGLLRRALDQLPPREAEVFCLRYFEGLDHMRIATVLRIKPGAVATALCKGRAKLNDLLARTIKGD